MSRYTPYDQAVGERAEESFSTYDAAEAWILSNADDPWNWVVEQEPPTTEETP